MMILKAIVLVGLLVATASGSAVKGREEYTVKGARQLAAPVEYQRSQQYEQREAYAKGQQEAPAPAEQAKLADAELYQQREEKQQFYEAQPQLRAKTEERAEQLPEQTRYEDYQQQREEPPAQVKQPEPKGAAKQQEASQFKETKQVTYEKQQYYEAKPQVREEVVAVAAPAVVSRAATKSEPFYPAKTEERREEQAQYQAPAEQQTKLEEAPRSEEFKGQQKYDTQREELRASAKGPAFVQRTEEHRYEQQEPLQQAVELTKQDYEQRRFEEQTEQRAEEPVAQVREEGQLKGGLRPAGAEAEPYAFDYSVEGSSRRESGDQHGVVRGQYTLQGADGSQRVVDYVADRDGFRAQVQTNEFGTESQQPANVAVRSSQPSAEGISLRLEGKTREYAAAPVQQLQVAAAPAVKSVPQPFVQVAEVVRAKPYEESRAYKEAPVAVAKGFAEPQYEPKAPAFVQEPAPYKGQELATVYQQRAPEPVKSADLKAAPRAAAPVAQLRSSAVVARASGFESATAHRPVVHSYAPPVVRHVPVQPVPVQPVVPVVPVVRHQFLSPVRSHQPHLHSHNHRHHHVQPAYGVSRSQLQHDRYPPASYRREQPLNPRVSFYANNYDDEHSAGFDHPAELI